MMKISHLGLLVLLPIGLMGCGSDADSADTGAKGASTSKTGTSTKDASTKNGKVIVVGTSGVQFSLPPTWTSKEANGRISCSSADGAAAVTVVPVDDDAAAQKTVSLFTSNTKGGGFTDYKEDGAPASTKLGALDSTQQTGTYKFKDEAMSWTMDTVKGKTPVVIHSSIGDSSKDKNGADLKALMDSFQATN